MVRRKHGFSSEKSYGINTTPLSRPGTISTPQSKRVIDSTPRSRCGTYSTLGLRHGATSRSQHRSSLPRRSTIPSSRASSETRPKQGGEKDTRRIEEDTHRSDSTSGSFPQGCSGDDQSPLCTSGDISAARDPASNLRAPRGCAQLDTPPEDPNDRLLIHIISDKAFDLPQTVRTITSIILAHMPGPVPFWSEYPQGTKDLCFHQFLTYYRFETPLEEEEAKPVFQKIAARRYKDQLCGARSDAMKKCKTTDILRCEGWMPNWIKPEYWRGLLQIWSTPEWQRRSVRGSQNRLSGEDSVVRHAGGSISVLQHKEKMRRETGKDPSVIEVFDRMHKKKKTGEFVNQKAKSTYEEYQRQIIGKYGEDPNGHPEFDEDIWLKVTGGVKKGGKVYGCGNAGAAQVLFGDRVSSSLTLTGSSTTSYHDSNTTQQIIELKLELETQKRESNKKIEEMSKMMNLLMQKLGVNPSTMAQPSSTEEFPAALRSIKRRRSRRKNITVYQNH
ncbi:Transposase, Ptta/En/Spm, plant [Quillaja saponaria]|uniref:Transposase, Ptta/En/Spm, plant n=1 Tax=Quillaja saponaria TaxID=32244 RepID=A0AAD7PLE6_QUISA|nr:Transposase, Ptta/En/Spm, plant [Quillaja saponaria]